MSTPSTSQPPSFTKPQILSHLSTTLDYTPFTCCWIPLSARISVCGSTSKGSGIIEVYTLDDNKLNKTSRYTLDNPIKCSTYNASNKQQRYITIGDYKGNVSIIDIGNNSNKQSQPTVLYTTKASSNNNIVNSIYAVGGIYGGEPIEIASATKDCVRLFDIRQQEPVINISSSSGSGRDCWSVCIGNSVTSNDRYLAIGYDNGDLKIFDLRINQFKYQVNIGNGIIHIEFDRVDIEANKLLVCTLEGKIYIFDMRTFNTTHGYTYESYDAKHNNTTVWQGKHTQHNRDIFSTTGGNGSVNIWKYNYPDKRSIKNDNNELVGVCGTVEQLTPTAKLAEQPIVSFDWHNDKLGLFCMCSLDGNLQTGIVTRLNTV